MEFGPNPNNEPTFKTDFSEAMQLFGEAQLNRSGPVSGQEYARVFCIALLAADIAEDKLSFGDSNRLLNPEDLGLSFEDNEPISMIKILEKGVKATGGPDFSFVPVIIDQKSVRPDQPRYTRYLREHYIFPRIRIKPNQTFQSKEEILHALLADDNRVELDTSGFEKNT